MKLRLESSVNHNSVIIVFGELMSRVVDNCVHFYFDLNILLLPIVRTKIVKIVEQNKLFHRPSKGQWVEIRDQNIIAKVITMCIQLHLTICDRSE